HVVCTQRHPIPTLFPYTTLFRSGALSVESNAFDITAAAVNTVAFVQQPTDTVAGQSITPAVTVEAKDQFGNTVPSASVTMSKSSDRKSTRLNSSHGSISYAVFCL